MTEYVSPLQRYQRDVDSGILLKDAAQARVIAELDDLAWRLMARAERGRGLWARLVAGLGDPANPSGASTFGGGVGRGKTHLVDTFFDCLPFERKLRVHFHRFMQRVHAGLTRHSGAKNPLEAVAQDIADEAPGRLLRRVSSSAILATQ